MGHIMCCVRNSKTTKRRRNDMERVTPTGVTCIQKKTKEIVDESQIGSVGHHCFGLFVKKALARLLSFVFGVDGIGASSSGSGTGASTGPCKSSSISGEPNGTATGSTVGAGAGTGIGGTGGISIGAGGTGIVTDTTLRGDLTSETVMGFGEEGTVDGVVVVGGEGVELTGGEV